MYKLTRANKTIRVPQDRSGTSHHLRPAQMSTIINLRSDFVHIFDISMKGEWLLPKVAPISESVSVCTDTVLYRTRK